jgi:predicted nucleotide-binding protein
MDLETPKTFAKGDYLRIRLDGDDAKCVLVRLLGRNDNPNDRIGIVGGPRKVGIDKIVTITLTEDYPSVRQISVHGNEPWGQTLVPNNGSAKIISIEYEPAMATPEVSATPSVTKIFVVHGHDIGARDSVARFLQQVGLEPIILQEQPDRGLAIIEKFEAHANQITFAVVLLTPDDVGALAAASAESARARQNVIFELGYFVGILGRGRVCLLRKGDVEIPSDLYGVIYTDMDNLEGWKLKLFRELKAAGLEIDATKL